MTGPSGRLVRRRSTRSHRRSDQAILIALVIAIIVTTFNAVQVQSVEHSQTHVQLNLFGLQQKLNADQARIGHQFQQLVQACVRLNILRAEDNVSHYADYKVDKAVYVESLIADKLHGVSGRDVGIQRRILTPIRQAYQSKSWTPLTNCRQAVNEHGTFYRPPNPILFVHRPPSRYDLHPPRNSPALGGE